MIDDLTRCGNYWGVAIGKDPVNPRRWKADKSRLMSYEQAKRKASSRKENNAVPYLAVCHTVIRPLDIDPPDGMTDLRDDQIALIKHYSNDYPAPIEKSRSGVGRHIYLRDPDGLLRAVGKEIVNSGRMPCEILDGKIEVTENWLKECSIPVVDNYILELIARLKTRKPEGGTVRRHPLLDKLLAQYDYMIANNIEFLPAEREPWGGWCKRMLAIGATRDEVIELCRKSGTEFNTKNDDIRDVMSMTPYDDPNSQMTVLLAHNYKRGLTTKLDLSQYGWDEKKSHKDRLIDINDKHLIVSTGRPIIDYQTCLGTLGIKIREHSYLGFQWSDNNGKTYKNYQAGLPAHIYKQVLEKIEIAEGDALPKPPSFARETRRDALDELIYSNKHNPLIDYINELKKSNRPINPEAKFLLSEIFSFRFDDQLSAENLIKLRHYFGDALLLAIKGIVARALYPGANFPFFLLFIGPKGCGKSLLVEWLLPLIARSGYADSFDWGLSAKERDMILRSAALVECSEMVGHGRKAISDHKSIISSKRTRHRAPYQQFPEEMIRNAVMIGTSNETECLPNDPGGTRRYIILPVDIHEGWQDTDVETNLPAKVDELRDDLFRLAIAELDAGRGCSIRHWHNDSRVLMDRLFAETERRHYPIELAIDHLINPEVDGEGQPLNKRLTVEQIEHGIPLFLPAHISQPCLMKLLTATCRKQGAMPPTMTSEWLADKLRRKGWIRLKNRPLIQGFRATLWRPPSNQV